jgi:CHASE2 domain-containing sensor protein
MYITNLVADGFEASQLPLRSRWMACCGLVCVPLSQQQPKPGENLSVVAITVACSAFGSVGHLVYRGYVVQTLRAMLALLLGRRAETS